MKIEVGSVYQMTGEFGGIEKYEAVRVVAIRRDGEMLKYHIVSSGEKGITTIKTFKENFTNVDDF